ncbi:MAG: pyruvate carboxyltransferase [Chloroflexi bacterium AL-W]|nr:pyruvate carboxyltransferase [Chloroflexi bacterium AL-N1]NOK65072.1 pyruvate carboxyltransferase [Chloroflexi bacterium AL-N10]NOK72661.1 pyruvate carboxyltransferase [Chloroflexi bacterium AL-N5]NOK79251.1 pyruvate carboxyltransferase [Chloroflexi bacterium AL-W]NOK87167.1 pyruvate carboxyltransferase [Chloroflexi bacterium AL-N15]
MNLPFLAGENPAQERYREATELFALFDYLRQQHFGVFSIRESLQAVGERRDGTLQGFCLSADETWQCIEYMDSLGVGVVELPSYPANEYGQNTNRRLIDHAWNEHKTIEFAAHARCVLADVEAAHNAGFRRLHLYIGTSKIKQATARASIPQLAEKMFASVELARELGFTSIRVSTEDAFRTTLDDYETFYTTLQALLISHQLHIDGIGIPDSVGVATIPELGDRIALLRRIGIHFDFLECHVHNDIGNADHIYVNTLLLCMRLGITMLPDFSILGIGERNGTIGLSSLLEAIYRRLILLYPHKMAQIRHVMREQLGTLPNGKLFVNCYRDMDAYFYRILSRNGFVFDRSPFSANTEYDGSGVHADTTRRAYHLALEGETNRQDAIDAGNSAYCGALPPYDMPLRTPVLACFGCGKSNVRYWCEREGLVLRPIATLQEQMQHVATNGIVPAQLVDETSADEFIAQMIRHYSITQNGITHQEALELVYLFYQQPIHTQQKEMKT